MITDITSIQGFFYGLPAEYALVDALSYRIWMVDTIPNNLIKIKDAFVSKRNFVVVELSDDKSVDNKVDNSVILNWKFIKQYGVDYFLGKDSLDGFPNIVNDDAWAVIDNVTFTDLDLDLYKQLFLYRDIVVRYENPESNQCFFDDINDYISRGLTITDMHNNLFDLASYLYAQQSPGEARHLFAILPPHMKYD